MADYDRHFNSFFWYFFIFFEKKIEKIRTNSRLALSSDFRVLVETTGIEPAKIIFHSKFPKTITISSRTFSVIYKLTITYKI